MHKLPRIGAAKLRSEYELRNPIKASTPSFDKALNDMMPDEVDYGLDFDEGVLWEAAP